MAVYSPWRGQGVAKVVCWELAHVAGSSALWLPHDAVKTLVPVGQQNNYQQWQCLKVLASHSLQVQAWEPGVGKM